MTKCRKKNRISLTAEGALILDFYRSSFRWLRTSVGLDRYGVYRHGINGIRRQQSIEVLHDNGDLALSSRTMNGYEE